MKTIVPNIYIYETRRTRKDGSVTVAYKVELKKGKERVFMGVRGTVEGAMNLVTK